MFAADIQGILGIDLAEGKKATKAPEKKSKIRVLSEKNTTLKTSIKKKISHVDIARKLLKGTSIDPEEIINQIGEKKLDENHLLDSLKKFGKKPVRKWRMLNFTNSARNDTLALSHFVRIDKNEENYRFSVFNKKYPVPEYSDELYNAAFTCDDWTKEETQYLMQMADKYHLLWPVISDRYCFNGKTRDANDLKRRFHFIDDYVKAFKDVQPSGFDYISEKRRRGTLDNYLSATVKEAIEEETALKQYTLLMRHENELVARKRRNDFEEFAEANKPGSLEVLNAVGKRINSLTTSTASSDDGIRQIIDFGMTAKPMDEIPNFTIGAQSASETLARSSERTNSFFESVHKFYEGNEVYSHENAQNTIRMRSNFSCIAERKGSLVLLLNELENLAQILDSLNVRIRPLPKKCAIDYFMEPRPSSVNRRFQYVSLFSIIPPIFPPPDIMDYSSGEPKRRHKWSIRFPEKVVIPEGTIPKQIRPLSPRKRRSSGGAVLSPICPLTPPMGKRLLVSGPASKSICFSTPRVRRISSTESRSRFSSSSVCFEIDDEIEEDGPPVVTRSGRTVKKKTFYDEEFVSFFG